MGARRDETFVDGVTVTAIRTGINVSTGRARGERSNRSGTGALRLMENRSALPTNELSGKNATPFSQICSQLSSLTLHLPPWK